MGISLILTLIFLLAIVILAFGIKRKNKVLIAIGSILAVFVAVSVFFIGKALDTL